MPTRIIRDGCIESERIDALSLAAEAFYKRLWHVVDDFGRYEYDPAVLLSKTFPRKGSQFAPGQVELWIAECATPIRENVKPLVVLYEVGLKKYLQVTDFRQRIRPGTESKWPAPPGENSEARIFAADGGEAPRNSATRARSTSPTTPTSPPVEGGLEETGTEPEPFGPQAVAKLDEGWCLFRAKADSVGMGASDEEWWHLQTVVWPRMPIERQLAAIKGIEVRRHGEYREPAYVPLAEKYLTKGLWTRPLRPVPKPPVSAAANARERGNREFEERMGEIMQKRKASG